MYQQSFLTMNGPGAAARQPKGWINGLLDFWMNA